MTDETDEARTLGEAEFAAIWRAHRPYLLNLAYGMLRDIGAAEDAVQDAFARLAAGDIASIDNVRAWLTVVTSRICLDQINSARRRRERTVDADVIDYTGDRLLTQPPVDPADRATLDDEVRGALLVVLDRLSPAERVVFVLHDVFRTPFDEIAETLGRPAATCRQLARRARAKIDASDSDAGIVETVRTRQVVDRFIEATSTGDLTALVPLLDPDVWGDADMGPHDRRSGVANHGSTAVSRNLLRWFGAKSDLVLDPLGDESELLAFVDGRLYAVIQLSIADGVVRSLHVIADPAQLAGR